MEIINKQINQLENEKVFKDLEYKCKKSEYNRRYYLKNRERLIKKNVEHFKHYDKKEYYTRLYNRMNYYFKNGTFNNVGRSDALNITEYLINNGLSIKYIEFVKCWFDLINININQPNKI